MTRGLDITYDAGLFGGDPSFNLYTRLVEDNGVNFMLQCLPDNDFENLSIPIGFDCKVVGEVTFTADMVSLPSDCRVILEDRLLGKFTDLAETPSYTVNIDSDTYSIGRFYLNTSDNITKTINGNVPVFHIYAAEKKIFVEGTITTTAHANLYDISGRLVKTYSLAPSDLNVLPASGIPEGIYMLRIFDNGFSENKKILLK
jgi:hypothetical protein